jgi:hypothetical protein
MRKRCWGELLIAGLAIVILHAFHDRLIRAAELLVGLGPMPGAGADVSAAM